MDFNQWYNQNSTLVSFINIAATVLLTALNVWFARKSQKYSAETVRHNEGIRLENNTPNIIGFIDLNNAGLCFFNLSNHGSLAAKNIKVELNGVNGSLVPDPFIKTHMYRNVISFLAPNQSLRAVMSYDNLFSRGIDNLPSYQLILNYEDIDNRHYTREYVLDLNMYNYQFEVRRDMHDLNKEIQKVEKHLKKVADIKTAEIRMEQALKIKSSDRVHRRIKRFK